MAEAVVSAVAVPWLSGNQHYVALRLRILAACMRQAGDDCDALRHECARVAAAMPARPALLRLAYAFGLRAFETDVLLLCAGVELDASIGAACALAQGDPLRPYPTFDLALAALPQP